MGCKAIRTVVYQRFDGVCVWCGKTCKLDGEQYDMDLGTVDHMFPRSDPRRLTPNSNGIYRKLLACYRCNNTRGETLFEDFVIINVIRGIYATRN